MIFYFSATGNCKYVADRIAAATGNKTVSIADCRKNNRFSFDESDKTAGIVSPTYAWGLPILVREFLEKLTLRTKPDYQRENAGHLDPHIRSEQQRTPNSQFSMAGAPSGTGNIPTLRIRKAPCFKHET